MIFQEMSHGLVLPPGAPGCQDAFLESEGFCSGCPFRNPGGDLHPGWGIDPKDGLGIRHSPFTCMARNCMFWPGKNGD